MTYLTCDLSKVQTTRMLRKNLNKQVFRPTTLINTTLVNAKIKALQLLNLFDFWSFSTFRSYVHSAVALTRLTYRAQTLQRRYEQRAAFIGRQIPKEWLPQSTRCYSKLPSSPHTVLWCDVALSEVMNPNTRFSHFVGMFKFKNPKKYLLGRITCKKKM